MSDTKSITVHDVLTFVYGASQEDRKIIVGALNACHNDDILTARMEFRIGDKVKFETNKRGIRRTIRGVVTKKNVKTIHVKPTGDSAYYGSREWRVTASLLKKDED